MSLLDADAAADEKRSMRIVSEYPAELCLKDVTEGESEEGSLMEGDEIADVVDGDIADGDFVNLLGLGLVVGEFPNVRHHNQDKAHASRRVTSRLWKAQPDLWDVYMRKVRGKTSIMRMTKTRPLFGAQLAEFIKNDGKLIGAYISQMGLAMHRFDSASKPMVMGVLCLLPLCAQGWRNENQWQ